MRVAIIGRSEILYDTAVRLRAAGHEVVCILTAKEAPEYQRGAEDFRALAEQWAVPFVSSARIREHRDFLAQARPDIAVSINYSGVIPEEITALFPLGILNAHGGDLPRYRGNACQAWAILNGEEKIGLCIHKMEGGKLDSGDIVIREYLDININTKITDVLNWFGQVIPDLFLKSLNFFVENPGFVLEKQSADSNDILRCYPRKPEDGRITWSNSNEQILRLINASNHPYAGAFCTFENKTVRVWDAVLAPEENFCAVPGQVTSVGDGYIDVACGSGKLRLLKVEFDGHCVPPSMIISSMRARFSDGKE